MVGCHSGTNNTSDSVAVADEGDWGVIVGNNFTDTGLTLDIETSGSNGIFIGNTYNGTIDSDATQGWTIPASGTGNENR